MHPSHPYTVVDILQPLLRLLSGGRTQSCIAGLKAWGPVLQAVAAQGADGGAVQDLIEVAVTHTQELLAEQEQEQGQQRIRFGACL